MESSPLPPLTPPAHSLACEAKFAENEIYGEILLELGLDDLDYMGIKVLGHRKKLLKGIEELKRNGKPANNPPPVPSHVAEAKEPQEAPKKVRVCELRSGELRKRNIRSASYTTLLAPTPHPLPHLAANSAAVSNAPFARRSTGARSSRSARTR